MYNVDYILKITIFLSILFSNTISLLYHICNNNIKYLPNIRFGDAQTLHHPVTSNIFDYIYIRALPRREKIKHINGFI